MTDTKSLEVQVLTPIPLEALSERVLSTGLNTTLASQAKITLTDPEHEESYAVIDKSQPGSGTIVKLAELITVGEHTSSQYRVFSDGRVWQTLQGGDEYSLYPAEIENFNDELTRVLSPLTKVSVEIEL